MDALSVLRNIYPEIILILNFTVIFSIAKHLNKILDVINASLNIVNFVQSESSSRDSDEVRNVAILVPWCLSGSFFSH